ncbi:MAG TPA: hypothetical protein P5186_21785 [Candidatus Paceibacterota bacterium]|nr:hypothetical protein [Verrucomicrobiota bacterium]HRY50689.1 hypothetical protein [Candidatus Paceibacterota bacterium]
MRKIAALAGGILLLPAVVLAQTTPFTATGWINGVQSPPIICTNALGQVLFRGYVHSARVQATDPRVTGQVLIINDGHYNADGTANMQGNSYLQVGTWDAAGTNFVPTGGLWDWSWTGVMQPDNSAQVHIVGYGSGGTIDGLRIDQTLTRAKAASPLDPTVPYVYAGTILPPPLNTIELVNDFNEPFTGASYPGGTGTCSTDNGRFYAVGDFPTDTGGTFDYTFLLGQVCPSAGRNVANDTTCEWRADLISLDENATNMAGMAVSPLPGPGYAFYKGRDFAFLLKWSKNYQGYSILWSDRFPSPIPNTNVVLAFALTREDPNVVITARVLDMADPNHALFSHSVLDTPASDPSLTPAQFYTSTGMQMPVLVPDAAEPPPTSSIGTCLGLFQYTDGQQPAPTAVYDNFELRTSGIPFVGVERAVRLSWPVSATINYAVEAAPTVLGPWLPLQDQTLPGFQIMTVPATEATQFFRLIQTP